MNGYFDHELCRYCDGKCCQTIGCALRPEDFKQPITEHILIKRLRKDIIFSKHFVNLGFAKLLGENFKYNSLFFPRIKGKKDKHTYIRNTNKGYNPCMYWSRFKGCKLLDNERPYGGISLIPNRNPNKCYNTYEGSLEHYNDWIPYQEIILKVLKYLETENKRYI